MLRVCCTKAAGACNLLSRRGGTSANFATLSVTDLSLRYLGPAEARSQLNLGTGGNAYAGTMSTVKYNKNKEGVGAVLHKTSRVVKVATCSHTHTCEASSPNGFSFYFGVKCAAILTQLPPLQLKMMSGYTTRMRTSTKARYFMTIKLHRATKAKTEPGMSQNEIHVPVSGGAGSGGVKGCLMKGATYRNAGAGAGAGGRRTLYRNQRHSVAGKRTPPESKQRWRDEHNCVEDEKTQSELGCLSPLVLLPLRCLRFSLPLRWLTV